MMLYGIAWSQIGSFSTIVLTLLTLAVLCETVFGFTCPPCNKIHCSPRRPSKLQCKGGITTGVCGCCPVCAKVEGEKCGGEYAFLGKCDRKLYCALTGNSTAYISRSNTLKREPEGVCKKESKKRRRGHQSDAAFVEFCRPKCTIEFCSKHPRAICSARDSADTIIDCHGKCQHTSCRACELVQEPSCPPCSKNDFRCLKKYGRCMQKYRCSKRKKSCKISRKMKIDDTGKFVCKVPDCP